jgi:FtsZ-binding cell division protein ZapB
VAQNENSSPSHRTNFHVVSDKTVVYEVRNVPFASSDYDGVREYIKHQTELGGPSFGRSTLFLLRDELIVGCPPGKDLTKDEGFEAGLPCWAALPAIRSEGRLLVPGPLPNGETYECEALASSFRKLLASDKSASVKLTKAQLKAIQELIASGKDRLDAIRAERLRTELEVIDQHDGATEVLLAAVMAQPKIAARIDQLVKEKVDAMLAEKQELRKSIDELKREKGALAEEQKRQEREQRAMAPAVAKAIRNAFDKARLDPIETLGQVAVFKALIDETIERPGPSSRKVASAGGQPELRQTTAAIRQPRGNTSSSVADVLRSLGVTPRCAQAYEVVGQIAQACGLILVVDGLAARLAAEGWLVAAQGLSKVLECRIGMTDDSSVWALLAESPAGVAMLDANLSPLDAYAIPIIDAVQLRVAGTSAQSLKALVVISLSRGVAALPIPSTVESVSLRVELDRYPQFLSEADARQRMVEIAESDEQTEWLTRLWKPAARRVRDRLNLMSPEDASLALSVLDVVPNQG